MHSPNWQQHVHPHGPLHQIAGNTWQVTGSLAKGHVPRNMVVHKMANGGLWLHSVVALDETRVQELAALGRPEIMVVPSGLHRLDAAVYRARFPQLQVLCPRAARPPEGKVLVLTDMLFNLPRLPGLDGLLFHWLGSTGFFGVTRIGRWLLLQDKRKFGEWLTQMARLPGLYAVCVAHGDAVIGGAAAAEALEGARARLEV